MLIPDALNNLSLKGIIHVGAHLLEENSLYRKLNLDVFWIEANPKIAALFPNVTCAVVSDVVEDVEFIISNNTQSSSLLKMKHHSIVYPNIIEVEKIKTKTTTLNDLIKNPEKYDAINLDIQGAELKALKGATNILPFIRAIYSEVNKEELYENCAKIEEIDTFLKSYGFNRIMTRWEGNTGWGDALYTKE
jgi:FkbM family methyltransferase